MSARHLPMLPPYALILRREVQDATADWPPEVRDFLVRLVERSWPTTRAFVMAEGCHYGSLLSRVTRAGLPTLGRVMADARLVHLAFLADVPSRSVAECARLAGCSSPQHVHRFVRVRTGLTPKHWRVQTSGAQELAAWIARVVTPHRAAWTRVILGPAAASPEAAA